MHPRLTSLSAALLSVLVLSGCSAAAARVTPQDRAAARKAAWATRPSPVPPPAPPKPPADRAVRLPILVYHHIRENQGWGPETWSAKMSVSPAGFARQMQWIADHGYTTVTMDNAAAILRNEIIGPAKPLVITFDDNNLSGYDLGLPVLKKHGFIATFYIVTDRLDNTQTTDRKRLLEMRDAGMDIQSHTISHRALPALPVSEIDREMLESKRALEDLLSRPVRHVAYPGTAHNQTVRDRTKAAGYVTGTIMDPRAATEKDDPYKLPRIMMIDTTDLAKILP